MGWRFRHSFKIIPGVRLNLSKTGLSASVGGAPFTLNVGPRGLYGTASIPGAGISYRHKFGGASDGPQTQDPRETLDPAVNHQTLPPGPANAHLPLSFPQSVGSSAPTEEVRSASTELLTSESLKELKHVIQTTYEEHEDIAGQLVTARVEKERASARYESWQDGFLFKRIFKKAFAKRKTELDTSNAKVDELEEQLRLTTIATHVEIEKEQAEPYFRLRDDFSGLSECAAIWDVKSYQATDKFHERTTANMRVDRGPATFSVGSCDLIQWEQKVPHFQNIFLIGSPVSK